MVSATSTPAETILSLSTELPTGANTVTVTAVDSSNQSSTCTTTISMLDTTAPVILSASANPNVLWPLNHRMVGVQVHARVTDNCSQASWKIVGVQSNEPVNGRGDGNSSPDWLITGDHTVLLRAEREGKGLGRIYLISIQAEDNSGNVSETKVILVTVPKGQTDGKRRN